MFPRFLVVESTDPQKKLRDFNDNIMDLTIRGVTSASMSIKWMGPALLVEVSHKAYALNLLKMKQIDEFPVKVSPHRSLNSRKGVAKSGRAATGMSNEEVRDALNSSPRNRDMPFVAEACRVSVNRNTGKQPTGTFFLTFQATTLPKKIWLGFEQFDVHLYVATPCRCFRCQKFGPNSKICRAREEVCQTCATLGHSEDACPNSDNPKCLNCKGSHSASSRDCPRFVTEKAALQIQAESNCSFVDARKQVEQTPATTSTEPAHASTPEQHISFARTVAINQADLINRNLTLSEENARLREVINKLRQDNNPLICYIMNLQWLLSDKGTHVRFCWIPSHCGIEGNEKVDQSAKESLDHDIDPLARVHYADLKPLINSYIQQLVQIKWDVSVHGRDLYLLKPTLGPPKKFQHLTRAEEVVMIRLRIGHTKATKSHILSRGPPTTCHHCAQTLTIDHMLLECAALQEIRDEYYTADSWKTLFEKIPETCLVESLREKRFFYLIWIVKDYKL